MQSFTDVCVCAFLLAVLASTGIRTQGLLVEDTILISNPGIEAPLGRSVKVTKNDLNIRVAPGDR
jgi:hypothetical protein